jgi:hypothetical protein
MMPGFSYSTVLTVLIYQAAEEGLVGPPPIWIS